MSCLRGVKTRENSNQEVQVRTADQWVVRAEEDCPLRWMVVLSWGEFALSSPLRGANIPVRTQALADRPKRRPGALPRAGQGVFAAEMDHRILSSEEFAMQWAANVLTSNSGSVALRRGGVCSDWRLQTPIVARNSSAPALTRGPDDAPGAGQGVFAVGVHPWLSDSAEFAPINGCKLLSLREIS